MIVFENLILFLNLLHVFKNLLLINKVSVEDDLVEALDPPGQPVQSQRQLLLLVETRDLDDQLHGLLRRSTSPRTAPLVSGHFDGCGLSVTR